MSKKLTKELEFLIEMIKEYPQGINIEALFNSVPTKLPKRTLQYRLAKLVKMNFLKIVHAGKNSKYYFQETIENEAVYVPKSLQEISNISFSEKSTKIQKLISAPVQTRPHVSYRREFLEAYKPNQTFYLPEYTLKKLLDLGSGSAKGRPAGTYARHIYQRLLIDLSWNSSRLEGNTYSLLETEILLETGEESIGKNRTDTQMILNHKDAIEFIVDMAEEIDINKYTILNIHALLSNNLLLDPRACGRLRTVPVKIGKSVYHPIEIPQLIEEYFQIVIRKAAAIRNPFEQSFFLMVHLPYLQPFLDVNKRVSRLAGNIPLIRENLSPLTFVDVSQNDYTQGLLAIYELNRFELFRDVFVWAYERSASLYLATMEVIGQPDPFRVAYRDKLRQTIYQIVYDKMRKTQASHYIAEFSDKNIPLKDRPHFIEIAEVEISSLHEGNFARFKISPSIFFEWHKNWSV